MLERVNMFLIQFRSDLAKGVPVENELFLGTIGNWYRLSRGVDQRLRARGLLEGGMRQARQPAASAATAHASANRVTTGCGTGPCPA